ncbi:CMRF35-like molecule 8 isoform X1 [Takifugu rubripes]|uniref:CMRF35-like molecule 8 isoform X6 n=2 Tax=Takifugu rubripes TaxID=31033 RepID=UPI001145620A|nr:CMRF35-like molecule 8 isoform X6 [Takifugu rubripes]XP_029690611.1 CMRF35-like molecule 8 isoform X1 [Takifugu rubripes]XP_029690612.1 CMRF35-like molecule 8 isoform X1 [Takifugu rubripes]XP_029690613.1 CMRF35-like molecule 8 isoform X1 [Takifugu rubripes]
MALHLSISLLLTGLTGVYSVTTVTKVSVKAGDSVSIPCLYHPKYTSHVKCLCQGYYYEFCSYAVKTNWQSSGRFLISDDREKKVFTVTIKDVREGDTDFWCIVDINRGRDVGTYFQMSVTRDVSSLYVDHQEVTGFIGEQTTIQCYYQNSGQAKWCRVGGPCVTQSQGSIDGTTVFINETPPRVFTVTMSGLKMEDSGWYWCSREDLQMPVQIIVREKPSTTAQPETCTSPELVSPSTTDEDAPNSLSGVVMIVIISLYLFIVMVFLSSLIWFCIKRQKQIQEEPSAEMLDMACPEDEVIYSKMKTKPESSHQPLCSENEVTYSSVRIPEQRPKPMCSENEVTYSSVKIPGPERRPKETTDIYSKLANSRKL